MTFKQAIRGFDRDEVLEYIRKLEAVSAKRISELEREVLKRDKIIAELKNRIVQKDDQVEQLEHDIREKYQMYIDNYEQIGALVYESRVKGNQIVEEATQEAERIVVEADRKAKLRLSSVQSEVDRKLTDGKRRYLAVQEELGEINALFNQMQRKFAASYKEIHGIIQSMPSSLSDFETDSDFDPEEEYEPSAMRSYLDSCEEDPDEFADPEELEDIETEEDPVGLDELEELKEPEHYPEERGPLDDGDALDAIKKLLDMELREDSGKDCGAKEESGT